MVVEKLFDGKLDIIGDVHGEYHTLLKLLKKLGYKEDGNHPENRRLVFVGDLVDRGVDSVSTVKFVQTLVEKGVAQCVLGNHELGLITGVEKYYTDWFWGRDNSGYSRNATKQERKEILKFLKSLPLALENDNLRIIHAYWNTEIIQKIKHYQTVMECHNNSKKVSQEIIKEYEKDKAKFDLENPSIKPFEMGGYVKYLLEKRECNHVKMLLSGVETGSEPYFSDGKWRFVKRKDWWDFYDEEKPIVIGHYWRDSQKDSRFGEFDEWFGKRKNVFCVDYSVGLKHVGEDGKLGCLRYPEMEVILTD